MVAPMTVGQLLVHLGQAPLDAVVRLVMEEVPAPGEARGWLETVHQEPDMPFILWLVAEVRE